MATVPEELARREQRLDRIAWAKKEIEARARERFEQEQAAYEEQMAERRAKEASGGRKLGGRPPAAPVDDGPRARDQVNLTDPESRIMPTAAKKAWIQAQFEAGTPEIEVGSFVPPKLLPQMADTAEVAAWATTLEGLDVAEHSETAYTSS